MGGYQQLVRAEVIRGRFRDSFEFPKPFTPIQKTAVDLKLQDILHTFKKGHRIVIQVQSTWFPYIDRNPQHYVPNIFEAKESDFTKSTITIYGDSYIELGGQVQ
jgi:predicted acyl esterase